MMTTTTTWFLAMGAAALVVLMYELLFIFPLRLRQRRLEHRTRSAESALESAARMTRDLLADEGRIRDELRGLEESLAQFQPRSDASLYAQAISLAAQGAEPDRLRSCFGLAPGEAALVSQLHGRKPQVLRSA